MDEMDVSYNPFNYMPLPFSYTPSAYYYHCGNAITISEIRKTIMFAGIGIAIIIVLIGVFVAI